MPTTQRLNFWRDGGLQRVLGGAVAAFTGGATYAYFTNLPPQYTMRAGVACGMLAVPFFAVREVVAATMAVDGPIASTITGGVAGYFGALFTAPPSWNNLSRSAMMMGVGCGLVDVLVSGLDWKRKMYLVNRHDAALRAAADKINADHQPHHLSSSAASPSSTASAPSAPSPAFKWPYWFPAVKQIDEDYEELLRRQRATVQALEEEQARIAILLHALESVKAGKQVKDVELAEAALRPFDKRTPSKPSSNSNTCSSTGTP